MSNLRQIGRALPWLGLAALLSACATTPQPQVQQTATQEAATYFAKAKPHYTPPGPPNDPWGPYITEASHRFDVPERWVREVMRVESGGYEFRATGELTTSPVGAMGLMQLMPATYDEVRARYGLGEDAYDPHNNILAGTAYIREMYEVFGTPGFLAAYNGGPQRLQDYLVHNRTLPAETRRYVALIAPHIQGVWPENRAPAERLAVNYLPINIPDGPRYVRHTLVASRKNHAHETQYAAAAPRRTAHAAPVELAEAPVAASIHRASTTLVLGHPGIHLIEPAMASETMGHPAAGNVWAIQVGAYGDAGQAQAAAGAARAAGGHASVAAVKSGHTTLYRARVTGLTHESALQACHKRTQAHSTCLLVAPAG